MACTDWICVKSHPDGGVKLATRRFQLVDVKHCPLAHWSTRRRRHRLHPTRVTRGGIARIARSEEIAIGLTMAEISMNCTTEWLRGSRGEWGSWSGENCFELRTSLSDRFRSRNDGDGVDLYQKSRQREGRNADESTRRWPLKVDESIAHGPEHGQEPGMVVHNVRCQLRD